MSREEWERAYRLAWERYYTIEHIETMLRRAARRPARTPSNALFLITWFKGCIDIENVHPLESGFLRTEVPPRPAARPADRAGLAVLSALLRRGGRQAGAAGSRSICGCGAIYLAIKRDPKRFAYTDLAMTPVTDDETETRELFQTDAAQAFVGQQQHVRKVQAGAEVPV